MPQHSYALHSIGFAASPRPFGESVPSRCAGYLTISLFASILALFAMDQPAQCQVTINPQTFGATGNGITDDTAALNRAIAAIPKAGNATLSFPCGIYNISNALSPIYASNVSITGPISNCVTLKATGSNSFTMLNLQGSWMSGQSNLSQDTTANTFTVVRGGLLSLGIKAGTYVLVSDVGTASNGPGSPLVQDQQVVKVTAVAGDTATIEGNFATPYTVTNGSYVQALIAPVVNGKIAHLSLDGSGNTGANTRSLAINYAVSTSIDNVQASNFLGIGNSSGLVIDTGYRNSITNVALTQCGNGGSNADDSMIARRQSYATIGNITITNTGVQKVFSFALHETHFSLLQTISIDAGAAVGRPFKLLRASYNTINDVTVQNGLGADNGISVTDISTHNTFTNCVVLNASGKGIAMFGNSNTYNTFNNCTVKFATQGQFGQYMDAFGNFGDSYTTINGGTYCCSRSGGASAIISALSPNFTMSNATISDDLGQALNGIVVGAEYATVQNNAFSKLLQYRDIYMQSGMGTANLCGNSTPDGTTPQLASQPCANAAQKAASKR